MTHRRACELLRRNAHSYKAGRISRAEWCANVQRIMGRRFPREASRPPELPGVTP